MARHLARNVIVMFAVALVLVTVFEMTGRRVHVLPADASPGPVLASAVLLAAAMTVIEQKVRRRLL